MAILSLVFGSKFAQIHPIAWFNDPHCIYLPYTISYCFLFII
jgi:hypothetical protein